MRYETKIPVNGLSEYQIESIVKINKACFKELYPERRVNNIYFDDLNKTSYFENIDGLPDRIKYRIRWYGEKFGQIEPVLELKIKKGLTGYKKMIRLKNFYFIKTTSETDIISYIYDNEIPKGVLEEFHFKKPVLFNSYLRKYYLSFSKKIRLTIDKEIEYCKIENSLLSNFIHDDLQVIEFKYEAADWEETKSVINEMPLRIDKNSKFSRGVLISRE